MKLPYREGTWFGIPLRVEGFGVGLIARSTPSGKVILSYLFGPRRNSVPTLAEVEHLQPKDAVRVLRVGDLSLLTGSWPIIGQAPSWKRADWPD